MKPCDIDGMGRSSSRVGNRRLAHKMGPRPGFPKSDAPLVVPSKAYLPNQRHSVDRPQKGSQNGCCPLTGLPMFPLETSPPQETLTFHGPRRWCSKAPKRDMVGTPVFNRSKPQKRLSIKSGLLFSPILARGFGTFEKDPGEWDGYSSS